MKKENSGAASGSASGFTFQDGPETFKSFDLSSVPLAVDYPLPDAESMIVCPVGGVGRIGRNWTLYGFAGKFLLVDAGTIFAKNAPGIGSIMPDPACLAPIMQDLLALVVTHGHEDHIGAIHHLWPQINCPIYAPPFAAGLIDGRLREKETRDLVDLRTFAPGDHLEIGPFRIETVPITHSTPDCVALAISTGAGIIFHTGDWKFDDAPLVGPVTEMAALRRLGDRGVLAMLCDSTNAERKAEKTSEAVVARNMATIMKSRRGRIVIACFATNVARLVGIARAAAQTGRRVGLAGRSLEKADAIARELGIIGDDLPILAEVGHLRGLDRHETVIVCTGTQGEERAGLAKLAFGRSRRLPELEPGDTVILSSRIIPGNEEAVGRILDAFREQGIEVIEGELDGLDFHVTGHASRAELEEMYRLLRPRFAVPVHGEAKHLQAHAELALACGVEDAVLSDEGDILKISPTGIERVARIPISHLATEEGEGRNLIPWNDALSCRIDDEASLAA